MTYGHLVIFDIGGVACALPREEVRALVPVPHLWRPPSAPPILAGMANLDGHAVPVIRLAVALGLTAAELPGGDLYRHLILMDNLLPTSSAALLVDRVLDVSAAPIGAGKPDPGMSLNGCVEAEFRAEDGTLIHLLAAERLLFAVEQEGISTLSRAAEERIGAWGEPA
jgi:purine-binding chemotaxis protein CheW